MKIILFFNLLWSITTINAIHQLFGSNVFGDSDFAELGEDNLNRELLNELNLEGEFNSPPNNHEVRAIVVLRGYGHTRGIVHLRQLGSGPTQINGIIAGLRPSGSHGFHFHEYAVTGDCESAGEHFNPTRMNHGGRSSFHRHIGDLGNVHADIGGVARFNLIDTAVSLIGPFTVIGRSLVVHVNKDDLGNGLNRESKETGNSGGRLACGTVRFVHFKRGSLLK